MKLETVVQHVIRNLRYPFANCAKLSAQSHRRFLLFARQGELRHTHPAELSNQAACLTLLTNAVITWNTVYLDRIIHYLNQTDSPISTDDIAHLSPARFAHINPYGKFRFDTPPRSLPIGHLSLHIP